MAKRSFPKSSEHPPSLDRRRFLASAALATTASITAAMNPTEATMAQSMQPLPPFPEAPTVNISAVTASRIAEITERNNLRKEIGLPLLSIPKELRRIKTAEAYARFAKFSEVFRKRLQQKMLARVRRQLGQPDWKPQGMLSGGGMAFESEVSRNLARVYKRVGKCG